MVGRRRLRYAQHPWLRLPAVRREWARRFALALFGVARVGKDEDGTFEAGGYTVTAAAARPVEEQSAVLAEDANGAHEARHACDAARLDAACEAELVRRGQEFCEEHQQQPWR